ncbi:hypothetical protein SLS62_007907 [Diatrype stigma]|uniref:AB hydrolase-1 domain-containing protein n=1 Tax=Diatrype stigma TaxID=117547 RepID=A0AAN9YN21_9PEZI
MLRLDKGSMMHSAHADQAKPPDATRRAAAAAAVYYGFQQSQELDRREQQHGRGRRQRTRFFVLLSLGAALLFGGTFVNADSWRAFLAPAAFREHLPATTTITTGAGNTTHEWSWSSIKPSRTLRWHACYDGAYECARLDVPLDWQDPRDDARVVLAISKLRATAAGTDYRGAVFFNPGGPGGSGIWALQDRGAQLQAIIGRNHDVISWDPRGVGASTPRVDCWSTDALPRKEGEGGGDGGGRSGISSESRRRLWALQDPGVIDAHPGMLSDVYARAAAFSRMCEERVGAAAPGLLRHVSTASHARDLLEILDQNGGSSGDDPKLRYWGFSYGTVLGGVFASMYPERVERLVSDGNVDYREWNLGTHINFLRDTDRVMEAFYAYCHAAGPETCAFHAETPDAIRRRHAALLEQIRKNPVIIPSSSIHGPDMPQLVTWSDIKRLTSTTLYQPLYMFKNFAEVLRGLEARDGTPFYRLVRRAGDGSADAPICGGAEEADPPPAELTEGTDDAFPAIMCADRGESRGEETVEEFEGYTKQLMEISAAAGDVLALFRLACVGRTVKPKWRYDAYDAFSTVGLHSRVHTRVLPERHAAATGNDV